MTPPRDVLRLHADLRDRLENPIGPAANMVRSYFQHQYKSDKVGAWLSETIYRHLLLGRDYHVEENMVDLVTRRGEDPEYFSGVEKFGEFAPPFAMGFMVFGKPLACIEAQGLIQKSIAMTWGPCQAVEMGNGPSPVSRGSLPVGGRLIVFWANLYREPDEIHRESMAGIDNRLINNTDRVLTPEEFATANKMIGGWTPTLIDFAAFDRPLGPPRPEVSAIRRELAELSNRPWAREGMTNHLRLVAALWQLMDETLALTTSHIEPIDRSTRRWAARAKINADITVIKLRHEAHSTINPGSGTPLEYRVPVNGHRRTLHRGTPKQYTIWVRDHWRGPEGAPVRSNRKVYNLAR